MSLGKKLIKYVGIGLITLVASAGCSKEDQNHTIADHPEERVLIPAENTIDNKIEEETGGLMVFAPADVFDPEPRARTKVTKRLPLIEIISLAMRENKIPADEISFILAVGNIESNFNVDCTARTTGAGGIFQQLGIPSSTIREISPVIDENFQLNIFDPPLNKRGTRYISLTNRHKRGARGVYARHLLKMIDSQRRERDTTLKVITHWYRRGKINRTKYIEAKRLNEDNYWKAISKQHSLYDPYVASLFSTHTLYEKSRYARSYRCYSSSGRKACATFSEEDAEVISTAAHHAGWGGVSSIVSRYSPKTAKQYIQSARKRPGWGVKHFKYLNNFVKHRRRFEELYKRQRLDEAAVRDVFGKTTAKNLFREYQVSVWDD